MEMDADSIDERGWHTLENIYKLFLNIAFITAEKSPMFHAISDLSTLPRDLFSLLDLPDEKERSFVKNSIFMLFSQHPEMGIDILTELSARIEDMKTIPLEFAFLISEILHLVQS